MKTKILALVMFATASSAWADPNSALERERVVAVQHERADGVRVSYYAKLTTIAERDSATAQITIDTAFAQWGEALRSKDANSAGYWAQRFSAAREDQREADARAARFRVERDNARSSFEASAAKVRKLRARG